MGKRFMRWLQASETNDESYKQMDRNEKLTKRRQWVHEQWDSYQEQRQKADIERKRKRVRGIWVNLDRMVFLEGGHHSPISVRRVSKHREGLHGQGARLGAQEQAIEEAGVPLHHRERRARQ